MIVQIYEIQTPDEAETCIELGVDHLGSVLLSRDAWRDPAIKNVMDLTNGTEAKNTLIPLFLDPDTLFSALDYYRPHFVHFCESLTSRNGRTLDLGPFVDIQARVRSRFPETGIMRSIPVPRNGSAARFPTLNIARILAPYTDLFLTDTWMGEEPVEGYIGITGKTADWDLARDLVRQSQIPVILAGGLSPENVSEAVKRVRPAGADSCTQTNAFDAHGKPLRFRKDFKKVKKFIQHVRETAGCLQASGGTAGGCPEKR